jgi:pilus assembly protein Flp/PilA
MLTYAIVMVQSYLATLKREEGQGMAEYGLILALVALAVVAAFLFLGDEVSGLISGSAATWQPTSLWDSCYKFAPAM